MKTIEVLNQYPNTKSKQLIEDVLKKKNYLYGNTFMVINNSNMTKEKIFKNYFYSELSHPIF